MSLSPQDFSHHEDMDAEISNLEDFPWGELWEDSDSLFESLETIATLKSMPTQEELLAIDTWNSPTSGEAEFEDFALGEY